MALSAASPSPLSSPHNSMQYLSSLLSQRGPNALPYSEDVKLHIRQHLLNLMQQYPSLRPRPADFVHNDGTSVHLLQASGTVPMTYQGNTYNIPVSIWLLEAYPKAPPRVFVTPTKDMIIKRSHLHVDASGLVSHPYLHNWIFPRSNLVELARNLSAIFSQDPPLYTRPSSAAPSPSANRPTFSTPDSRSNSYAAGSASTSSSSSSSSSLSSSGQNPYVSSTLPAPSKPSASQRNENLKPPQKAESYRHGRPGRSGHTDDPAEVFKKNAINTLVDRFRLDTTELRSKREAEMDKLVTLQTQLKQRREKLKTGIGEIQKEKDLLEQLVQNTVRNADVLENWMKVQGKEVPDINIDEAFLPSDPLSKQLLECNSSDLAIEDVLYALDKAVQEGSIPFDIYLKQVRSLAREQFLHRATSVKVQAARMRIQAPDLLARYVS